MTGDIRKSLPEYPLFDFFTFHRIRRYKTGVPVLLFLAGDPAQ